MNIIIVVVVIARNCVSRYKVIYNIMGVIPFYVITPSNASQQYFCYERYAADGNRREGQWIDDQLHGFVTFTCKSCNTKSIKGTLVQENGPEQSKQIDVTKIERWRKGRRISDGVSERSPLVNLFDR